MARLKPYLKRTRGDIPTSLELYCWHAELASDVHFVLGMTEVFVRNAMDRQLQAWNRKQNPEATSWLLEDPAPPLDKLSASKRSQALNWANKESKQKPKTHSRKDQPSHDDVLSCVMFGMWADLLPHHGTTTPSDLAGMEVEKHRRTLWKQCLIHAFPNEKDPDGSIAYGRVARLHNLRNRVAHMEFLLDDDIYARMHDAFKLLESIDHRIAVWVGSKSTVKDTLSRCPI